MKRLHKLITALFITLILMVFSGCQKAEMNTEKDLEAIEALIGELLEGINSGDAAAAADHWSEDGAFLPPNSPMVEGRENIQTFLQGMIDMGLTELKAETVKLEVMGDMAYRIGRYNLTIQPEGSESITDKGKFVQVFSREYGTWELSVSIFNTDMPMPSPM